MSVDQSEEEVYITLGKRYTIIIPKLLRTKIPMKEGQKVRITRQGGRLILWFDDEDPHEKIAKILKGTDYRSEKSKMQAEEQLLQDLT